MLTLVLIGGLVAGAAALLERALRLCEPLDVQLGRSGCVQVIDLPADVSIARHLHVANVGNRLVVIVEPAEQKEDEPLQALIFDTQTWEVVERLSLNDVPVGEGREDILRMPSFKWDTTQLLRMLPPRIGFSLAQMPDNSVRVSIDRVSGDRYEMQVWALTDTEPSHSFVLPGSPTVGPTVLSHDGRRLLIPLLGVGLAVIDLTDGQVLYSVASNHIFDYDWLTDNQTIVVTLRDEERFKLALLRVPDPS
ncbi:hypothetical protein VZO05_10175 [Aggregatilineales bacterium SYSU G02658]